MRKNGTCKTCGNGAIFDGERNEQGAPVWKCRCCLGETPRKVYATKKKERLASLFSRYCSN